MTETRLLRTIKVASAHVVGRPTQCLTNYRSTPQFAYQGKPVTGFVSNKARALLIYLAVTGRAHSRDALVELLWADTPITKRENLKRSLSNLRRLDGVTLIEEGQRFITLDPDQMWVDVAKFAAFAGNSPAAADSAALQRALELYQDDFLAGFNRHYRE